MAIETAIITQWGNDSTLNGLVPSTSVSGGTVIADNETADDDPDELLPRAVLEVVSDGFSNSNKTSYELHTVTVRTTIKGTPSGNASANLIRAAIHDAFRNKSWTANGHKILLSRVTGTDKLQLDSGHWQLETTITTESVEV